MTAVRTARAVLPAAAVCVVAALAFGSTADAGSSWTRPSGPRKLWVKVTGSARNVAPGEVGRLDARLDNHHTSWVLSVDTLTVTITGIDKKHRACGLENYEVVPYSGPLPVLVKPRAARRLSALGIPRDQWPGVRLADRPWNQNACLGARLTVEYGGTAHFETKGDGDDDDDHDHHDGHHDHD